MHVYGELTGSLTGSGTLNGSLSAPMSLSGSLSIPRGAGAVAYGGAYEVTPKAYEEQILPTTGKLMLDDVTVFRVPYYETSNLYDGLTVFIAEDSNG